MDGTGTSSGDEVGDGDEQPVHRPVLLREVMAILELREGLVVVDGTVGAGGHAKAMVQALGASGLLVGLDRDSEILATARATLAEAGAGRAGARISLHHLAFPSMREALAAAGQLRCDRVLLDLGVSSLQLDRPGRGFSFMADGPLDMRMDATMPVTAADWLASISQEELADTIYQLGDERLSRRIARAIVEARRRSPIVRTKQLADIVAHAMPAGAKRGRIHPATRTFQAIRMAVNDELGQLRSGLEAAAECLHPGGRLAVITFHSLEDRVVKQFLRGGRFDVLTKKPIAATAEEVRENPRARSAKLRCGVRREEAA